MGLNEIVMGLLASIASIWLGSVEVRMRNLNEKLRDIPTRDEVKESIEIRQEALHVMQREIKEDIKEIKEEIKKLIADQR